MATTTFSNAFLWMKSLHFDQLHFTGLFPSVQLLAFVHMMACRWISDKPLPEAMMTQFTGTYASVRGMNCIHIFAGALEGPMQTLVMTVKSCENFALWDCHIRSLLMIHVISYEVEFYADCRNVIQYTNKDQSWYLTNDPSWLVEIIGIQNYTFGKQYLATN